MFSENTIESVELARKFTWRLQNVKISPRLFLLILSHESRHLVLTINWN